MIGMDGMRGSGKPVLTAQLDDDDDDGSIRGVMVTMLENRHGNTSSNPDETVCISYSANTLGKCMNSTIFPPAMWK